MTSFQEIARHYARTAGLSAAESDELWKGIERKLDDETPIPFDTVKCQKCQGTPARVIPGQGKFCSDCEP
jgi:hypothetical protein